MEVTWTILISAVSGIVSFFVGQNRTRKEVEGLSLQNVEKSLDIYNRIIEDLKNQIDELLLKVDCLEDKIDELKAENQQLKEMLESRNPRKSKV